MHLPRVDHCIRKGVHDDIPTTSPFKFIFSFSWLVGRDQTQESPANINAIFDLQNVIDRFIREDLGTFFGALNQSFGLR